MLNDCTPRSVWESQIKRALHVDGDTVRPMNDLKGGINVEIYANLGGDSSVVGYEIGSDFIKVQFSDGSIYVYTYASAGASNIEHMKRLARSGQGLNSFINRVVRKAYARREC